VFLRIDTKLKYTIPPSLSPLGQEAYGHHHYFHFRSVPAITIAMGGSYSA